jgi:hypothetical protein
VSREDKLFAAKIGGGRFMQKSCQCPIYEKFAIRNVRKK